MYSGVDAWRVIELQSSQGAGGYGEFLLVFQTLSIYVDIQGRKSRDREIMYPAVPTHISGFLNLRICHTPLMFPHLFVQLIVMATCWFIPKRTLISSTPKLESGSNQSA